MNGVHKGLFSSHFRALVAWQVEDMCAPGTLNCVAICLRAFAIRFGDYRAFLDAKGMPAFQACVLGEQIDVRAQGRRSERSMQCYGRAFARGSTLGVPALVSVSQAQIALQ